MNAPIDTPSQTIEARQIPNDERLQILPRHFGRHMLTIVTPCMRSCAGSPLNIPAATGGTLSSQTAGSTWRQSTRLTFNICVDTNGFEGSMSADAAGITACLFALSHLSFQIQHDCIASHFHLLRDFALEHAEASVILAAID